MNQREKAALCGFISGLAGIIFTKGTPMVIFFSVMVILGFIYFMMEGKGEKNS